MSLDLALNIARSGLQSIQRSLDQVGQNITNVDTVGYTRKTVTTQALYVGDQPYGVRTTAVQRAVDDALVGKLNQATGNAAGANVRERLLKSIEDAQSQGSDSLTLADTINGLQQDFVALRAAPADAGLQQSVLMAAGTVAQRLHDVGNAINDARQQAQDGIVTEVNTINDQLKKIGTLTRQIMISGHDTADLEDQRDQEIATLSQSIGVNAVKKGDGDLLLVTRSGLILPLDPNNVALSTSGAAVSPASASLPPVTMGGLDVTSLLTGGRLGTYVELRDSTLPRYQAETDQVAAQLATRLDQEGLTLFVDSDGSVPDTALSYTAGTQLGFAQRIQVNPAVTGQPGLLRDGTPEAAVSGVGKSTFAPNADGTTGYTDLLDRVLTYSFGSQQAAGVAWDAIAATGLGPAGNLTSPFLPPTTIQGYAASVSTAQVSDRAAATAAKTSAATLQTSLQDRFAKASGVDVDSEMTNLVSLQNAYAANARVITTVQTMWDTLQTIVR